MSESKTQPLFALYENAPGFIATTSGRDHIFTFANRSYRRFINRFDIIGRTVEETLPEIVDQGIISILNRVYDSGEPFVGRDMLIKVRRDDCAGGLAARYIDVVYQPVRNGSGDVIGLFCEGYDVTEKHDALEAIAALQAQMIHVARVNAMGTMAATLAHELNQPLSAIANYVSAARLGESVEGDTSRYVAALRGIESAARRASGIITHLRQLTRRQAPRIEAFDLGRMIDECVKLLRVSVSPNVRFSVDVPDGLIATANEVQIKQVMINLLVNACEAMEGRGTITIHGWEEPGQVIVSISDTGPGVDSAAVETLFNWSRSLKADGMGLGLAICRTILDKHHGKVWLERSDSTGAEFRFSIPTSTIAH